MSAVGMLARADIAYLGNMKAERILFLGNSICLAPPGGSWTNNWGASASAQEKDYVHLLTSRINAATGGSMTVAPPSVAYERWYYGNPLLNWDGNILNVADFFERNYNTWDNARVQKQIDAKPDIVVLQFGENMQNGTNDQFRSALNTLMTGLKNSSNPHIFVTSGILGSDPAIDKIKRDLCADDPAHRVFVDMTSVQGYPFVAGSYAHPDDKGMEIIADTLFKAMTAHAVPEPKSAMLLGILLIGLCGYVWKQQ